MTTTQDTLKRLQYDGGVVDPDSFSAAKTALTDMGLTNREIATIAQEQGLTLDGEGVDYSSFLPSSINAVNFFGGLASTNMTAFTSAASLARTEGGKAQASDLRELIAVARDRVTSEGIMTDYDLDQAVRMSGYGYLLDEDQAAKDYYVEVEAAGQGATAEQAKDQWDSWTPEFQQEYIDWFKKNSISNPEVAKSADEVIAYQGIAGIVSKLVFGTVGSTVGAVDWAASLFSGRSDMWDFTKDVTEFTSYVTNYGKSNQSLFTRGVSLASDLGSQVARMYLLNYLGGEVGGAFESTALGSNVAAAASSSAVSKGVSFAAKAALFTIKSSPFILESTGDYYVEAMQGGANIKQARLYAWLMGGFEGYVEAFQTDQIWGKVLGGDKVKAAIKTGSGRTFSSSMLTKMKFLNLTASFLGEATEEGAGYAASWALASAQGWNEERFSWEEMGNQALMGGLVGIIGSALSLPSMNQARIVAEYMAQSGDYSTETMDLLLSAYFSSTLSDAERQQYIAQGYRSILTTADYASAVENVSQNVRQLKAGEAEHTQELEALRTQYDKRVRSSSAAETMISLLNMDGVDIASDEYISANSELIKYGTSAEIKAKYEAAVKKSNDAYAEVRQQQTRAYQKSMAKIDAHHAVLADLFSDDIAYMAGQTRASTVDAAALAQYVDASRRLDELITAGETYGDRYDAAVETLGTSAYAGDEVAAYRTKAADSGVATAEKMRAARSGDIKEFVEQQAEKTTVKPEEAGAQEAVSPVRQSEQTESAQVSESPYDLSEAEARVVSAFNSVRSSETAQEWADGMRSDGSDLNVIEPSYNLPGLYDIPAEGRKAWSSREYAVREDGDVTYAVPINQGTLLENQYNKLSEMYDVEAGEGFSSKSEPGNLSYEMLKPAVLERVNSRYLKLKERGVIRVADKSTQATRTETSGRSSETSRAEQSTAENAGRIALTDEERSKVAALGERLGRTVSFQELPGWTDGYYENGTVILNSAQRSNGARDAYGSTVMRVLTHEMTHSIEGTPEYNELSEYVVNEYEKRGASRESLYESVAAAYRDMSGGSLELTSADARRELVAQYAEEHLFTDEAAIDRLVRGQTDTAGRLLNWIHYQIANMKARASGDAGAVALLRAERLYAKAFAASGKSPSEAARQYSVEKTLSGKPVAVVDTDVLDGIPKSEWAATVRDELKRKFPNGVVVGTDQILITKQSARELTRSKSSQYLFSNDSATYVDKMNAAVNADDVLHASTEFTSEDLTHPRKDAIVGFSRGQVLLRIGSNDYTAEVVIGKKGSGISLLYDIVNIKKAKHTLRQSSVDSDITVSSPAAGSVGRHTESITDTITRGDSTVNDSEREYSVSSDEKSFDELIRRYGAFDKGMGPRARDVSVPKQTGDESYVSQFMRSAMESAHVSDAVLPEVEQMVADGEIGAYSRVTNKEMLEKAKDYIASEGGIEKARTTFHSDVSGGKIKLSESAKMATVGMQLAAEAASSGDSSALIDVVTDLVLIAPQAGRSVQVYAMLKKLGGVGRAVYAQKMIDQINSKYESQISAGKMQQIVADPALMQQLAQAKTEDEIKTAEDAIFRYIGERTPLTPAQAISNWRYFSMLANPTTHIRNVVGNTAMLGLRKAKDAVAAGIETVSGLDASERTHAVYSREANADVVDYAETAWETYQDDATSGGKFGFESELRKYAKQSDIKWLDKLMKTNSRLLSDVEDVKLFLRPAFVDSFTQYMIAQGLTPETITTQQRSEAASHAIEEARKATFREDSALASALQRGSDSHWLAQLVVEGAIPFKKTPINIAKRGIEYSPIGLLNGAKQIIFDVQSGRKTASQAIDTLSSGIVGSSLVGVGALLAHLGVLRGKGDDDDKYETFLESTGEQPYSLNVGGASMSISNIAPAAMPLIMGARFYELATDSDEGFSWGDMFDTLSGIVDPLMDMSFLGSLDDVLTTYSSSDTTGGSIGGIITNAAKSYAGQYLPTAVAKAGQLVDSTVRTAKSSAASPLGSGTDYWLRSLVKKVPGAESALEPLVDVSGERVTKDSFGDYLLDFANKFVLPGAVKVKNRDTVDREIISVFEQTGNTDIIPSSPQKYVTMNGTNLAGQKIVGGRSKRFREDWE